MSKIASKQVAFFDVDTQHDFMSPRGALYVPGARMIAGRVRQLVAFAAKHGLRLFASTDAHAPDNPELKTFPPHCMLGTRGQQKIRGTLLPDRAVVAIRPRLSPRRIAAALQHQQVIIEKQTYDVFDNPNTALLLQASGARRFVVFGVATDYCVLAAVLGLLRRGYKVSVVSDAIRAVDPEGGARAIAAMRKAGARFVTTSAVIG